MIYILIAIIAIGLLFGVGYPLVMFTGYKLTGGKRSFKQISKIF